jgi:hypothetical protein
MSFFALGIVEAIGGTMAEPRQTAPMAIETASIPIAVAGRRSIGKPIRCAIALSSGGPALDEVVRQSPGAGRCAARTAAIPLRDGLRRRRIERSG